MRKKIVPENTLRLDISGGLVEEGQVPVPLLINILRGIQDSIYVLAQAELQRTGLKSERVSSSVRRAYELVKLQESKGSYRMDVAILESADVLIDQRSCRPILRVLVDFLASLQRGDESLLNDLTPDTASKVRLLRLVQGYHPRKGINGSSRLNRETMVRH